MKYIKKIVLYKTQDNEKRTCVFYNDGTCEFGTYEAGIIASKKLLEEKGLGKDGLNTLLSDGTISVETEEEFKRNKSKYETEIAEEAADNYYHDYSSFATAEYDDEIEDEELIEDEEEYYYDGEEAEETAEEIRYSDRIEEKDADLGTKIAIGAIGVLIGIGIMASAASCNRKSKVGTMTNSNITTTSISDADDTMTTTKPLDPTDVTTNSDNNEVVVDGNNDYYDDYSLAQLLDVTNNEFQKTAMINLSSTINGFNGSFADAYVESGNDIRAALTVDEVVALQMAYNKYSAKEIRAYFNGSEINAIDLSNDYKDASLELMDAYVTENSKNPVDMSNLIDSAEGKEFYNKYHEMFLRAKESTGSERINSINAFYKAVRKDFPITKDVRTTGTMHSDERKSIKDYKLSVAPMVAAADILFANDKVNRLSKEEIAFFNDIGLCNYADDKFERIETIMLSAEEDNTNPLYDQYRNAIIDFLEKNNQYVIDNDHRELSNLRLFKKLANPSDDDVNNYAYTGSKKTTTTKTTTKTTKKTWTDKKVVKKKVVYKATSDGGNLPDDVKNKAKAGVDKKIKDDNDQARKKAIKDSDDKAKKMQDDADKNADDIKKKIDKDDKDRQNRIDDANKKIDNGDKVKATDLGDDVHVDDPYVDNNGDVDDSVKNITTDPSGADQDLPDPNDTADDFEKRTKPTEDTTPTTQTTQTKDTEDDNKSKDSSKDSDTTTTTTTSKDNDSEQGKDYYTDYGKNYTSYDEDGNPISEEKAVELYIESLASEATREIEKVYVK